MKNRVIYYNFFKKKNIIFRERKLGVVRNKYDRETKNEEFYYTHNGEREHTLTLK
jgi:hypothetical protein